MKILHVITTLQTGGAEKLMVDLLPKMKDKGHLVELCVFDDRKTQFYTQLQKLGIKIHCIKSVGGYYSPICMFKLIRLMRQGWNIVHTHTTAPQLYGAIGSLFCNVHLVTTEHNTTNSRRHLKWYRPIDLWMFSRYEKHIMISDQCEKNHIEYIGNNCDNLTKIYNGIDFKRYSNANAADDIRYLGRKIITSVAAFRPQKDQPTLIKAMEYLPEEFHLCLVGGGNEERKQFFMSMINERNLNSRVHLIGIRSDIPEILAASDYIVMSSHFEGLSLASLEGMASGKPFIASDVDGLHEIVDGNGVLFEHENAENLARVILELDENLDYRNEVTRRCLDKAAKYDIDIMVEKYLQVYESII